MKIAMKAWGISTIFLLLGGCAIASNNSSSVNFNNQDWKIYSNNRYNFQFPYPKNWISSAPPDNDDGIAFISPRNKSVEIRGWAGNRLPRMIEPDTKTTIDKNFKTAQGIPGVLTVEVGKKESAMVLNLNQGNIKYYWQGKAPSDEFDDYYRFFYYVAQQYQVKKQ
ncbi:hypothetical protein [Calothrix sp. 336/3]|uniref:hypothetical protein n=1 Tax=Calothrix sp. 336/3 TaxID=1337936 RepID=UPI0006249E6A|nr:hypothetical protein [Calothrix sp. 336/3]AKG23356.1 hypothetical protein IJ00_20585 [Calothrix sp. 336/3]